MNALQVFNYGEAPVRVIDLVGEPWWVLADVCRVLKITNHKNVAARLDEDEKGVHLMDTPGGTQNMTVINESGLYSVILRSDKPEAKAFKRWITHEVIPAIRKTGSYSVQGTLPKAQSLSEAVSLGKFVRGLLKDQGANPYQTAEIVLDTMKQVGVNLSDKLMLPAKLDAVRDDELDMVEFKMAFPESTWQDYMAYRMFIKLSR